MLWRKYCALELLYPARMSLHDVKTRDSARTATKTLVMLKSASALLCCLIKSISYFLKIIMVPFLTFRAFHLDFLQSGSNIWCTTTRVTAVSHHYSATRSEICLPCAPPLYDQCPWLLSCVRRISTGTQYTYCYCHAGGIPFDWLQSTGLGKEGLF